MKTNTPIETPFGILHGRDSMFLERIELTRRTLVISVELNRRILSGPAPKKNPHLEIIFSRIVSMRSVLLDDYKDEVHLQSSLDRIESTTVVATYDWVFEVHSDTPPEFLVPPDQT